MHEKHTRRTVFTATAAAQPGFEVASIKPNLSNDGNESSNSTAAESPCEIYSLGNIIQDAYDPSATV